MSKNEIVLHLYTFDYILFSTAERNLARQSITKHVVQIENLNKSLVEKEVELSKVQSLVSKSTASVREAFDADRVMYEEKIATLTNALKGNNNVLAGIVFILYYLLQILVRQSHSHWVRNWLLGKRPKKHEMVKGHLRRLLLEENKTALRVA